MRKVQRAAVILIILLSTTCFAEDFMNAPFPVRSVTRQPNTYQTSTVKMMLTGMIQFYSSVISPADGPRSPSYPTGSAYGIQAIEIYGFFPGIFLIADRLLHESDINLGPTYTIYGKNRYFDPITNNTYWWDDSVLSKEKR